MKMIKHVRNEGFGSSDNVLICLFPFKYVVHRLANKSYPISNCHKEKVRRLTNMVELNLIIFIGQLTTFK